MSDLASNASGPATAGAKGKPRPKVPMTPDQAIGRAVSLMSAGKLDQAQSICQQVIHSRPTMAEAFNVLGVILHRRGQGKEAVRSIQKAIKLNGSVANFYANLGEMLRQQGETDKAITALRRASHLDPRSAQAFNNLGIAYFDKAQFEDAAEAYRKAISLDENYPEPHNNLGNALLGLGKAQEATECYERALALRPDYAEAHSNIATLLGGSGRFEEAEASLRRSIELRPENLDAYRHLAHVLVHQNRAGEAVEVLNRAIKKDARNIANLVMLVRAHLKRGTYQLAERVAGAAMKLDPDNPEVLCVYGQVCQELDRPREAIEYYERALAKRPEFGECRNYLAVALKSVGDFARAETELKSLIEKQPGMIAAYSNIADMIQFTEDHPYFLALRDLVEDMGEATDERATFVHYAIGKAYDDMGDYDNAVRHFSAGAAIKRTRVNYDEQRSQEFFDGIMKTYDAAYVADAQSKGHPSSLPIFIVGMPRSGSTLIEQVLASHPDVYGAGEIKVVSQSVHEVRRAFPGLPPFPEIGARMNAAHFQHFTTHYLNATARLSEDATHITDKLLTNYYFLGLLYKAFPNAKVIHATRNPVDTCISCYTKLFKDEMPYTYDLRELGRYYKRYQALMEHWSQVLPAGYMLEVKYEDMVAQLDETAKKIVAFCGLEWNDQCLQFHTSDRTVKTASVTQVRKPIYTTSVERWRRYGKGIQPLIEELGVS